MQSYREPEETAVADPMDERRNIMLRTTQCLQAPRPHSKVPPQAWKTAGVSGEIIASCRNGEWQLLMFLFVGYLAHVCADKFASDL